MKAFWISITLSLALSMTGCSSESGGSGGTQDSTGTGTTPAGNGNEAVSTWEGHSLKAEPKQDGKWVASIAFGETVTLLGDTARDAANKKTFSHVRLADGKEGWVDRKHIAPGGILGAVSGTADVYTRPGIANISDKHFNHGDLVVIVSQNKEWAEVTGVPDKANNRLKGWLLGAEAYTTEETDVAVAVLVRKAMAETNPAVREEKLRQIEDNNTYVNSQFYNLVTAALESTYMEGEGLDEAATRMTEDQLMIMGTGVNIRSTAEVKPDNKLFQLNTGDVCNVLSKGAQATLDGYTAYWYQIEFNGKKGWVFGKFTNRGGE